MRDVAIIGIGDTVFGELWDSSLRKIGIEAGIAAINDAGISGDDVDALYVGNMSAGKFIEQEHLAALIADYAGLTKNHIPATRVEAGGASGALALREGYLSVASGEYDIVVIGGAEKMTDVGEDEIMKIQAAAIDQEWESVFGATLPSLYAMMARRYMHEYGATREQFASVPVKNHANAAKNPKAQYRKAIRPEMVLNATMVADPLGMFDCAPNSDGAAAVVLAPMDIAKKYTDTPIKISGSGQASDTLALHQRRDILTMDATVHASRMALKQAGREVKDIQVAELNDNYSISEILALEDIGFVEKGKGAEFSYSGQTMIGGKVAVNTSGGLKARGNPLGATGIAQAVEIVRQLRGEAGERQVDGATVGLTHNLGGTGSTAIVHVLEVA